MTRYRWNASKGIWEFHEAAWGGWCVLRTAGSNDSLPMSFNEGFWHIATRPLGEVKAVEYEAAPLAEAARRLLNAVAEARGWEEHMMRVKHPSVEVLENAPLASAVDEALDALRVLLGGAPAS